MVDSSSFLTDLKKACEKFDNQSCADCLSKSVRRASVTFGVFLCVDCAAAHEKLGGDLRSVGHDSLRNEVWNAATVERFLRHGGNSSVNENLEAELPNFYRRPWPGSSCPMFLREAFARSKYVHEEFSKGAVKRGAQCQFSCTSKSGILLKKLRDSEAFCERFFELSAECNYLRYFIKPDDPDHKQLMDLEKLNMTFISDRYRGAAHFDVPSHTALIQFVHDGSTRHIFVRSEDSRTIINWYNAIRLGKYNRTCLGLFGMSMTLSAPDIAKSLTRDIDLAGWLSKTGPRKSDAWRKRWCMLFQRHMLYTDKPLSAFAKGELFIKSYEDGFSVKCGTPEGWKKHSGYAFTIHTETRPFVFVCESPEERDSWISHLEAIIKVPVTLEESKRAASIATSYLSSP
ncbi:Arf-GAP with dual PH domain-containing protein 1 [Fasciola hepatica]|uniref:Arf-GAP with dual PH domain-containing protein 1 n=1 Tax=Fasciola hepatica TaxID=6192 RepID=A0A2H1C602_FASHE|nr:Arf-GAP with dual PH domain-containing protein 1 [Fasciola hepatica]